MTGGVREHPFEHHPCGAQHYNQFEAAWNAQVRLEQMKKQLGKEFKDIKAKSTPMLLAYHKLKFAPMQEATELTDQEVRANKEYRKGMLSSMETLPDAAEPTPRQPETFVPGIHEPPHVDSLPHNVQLSLKASVKHRSLEHPLAHSAPLNFQIPQHIVEFASHSKKSTSANGRCRGCGNNCKGHRCKHIVSKCVSE